MGINICEGVKGEELGRGKNGIVMQVKYRCKKILWKVLELEQLFRVVLF